MGVRNNQGVGAGVSAGIGGAVASKAAVAGGGGSSDFSLDFTVLGDVNPYVFDVGEWETNINSGGDGKILSGHYHLQKTFAYQTRTVLSAAKDLTGEAVVFVEFTLDSPTDAGTAEFVLGLTADDAPGEWYGHFGNGEMENGYRYKLVGANCYVLRDVAGSYTLADTLVVSAITAASPTKIRIVVTVGASDVTHQVYQDDVLKDTFVETHASRHTNFRRAGFSLTSSGAISRLKDFRCGVGTGA